LTPALIAWRRANLRRRDRLILRLGRARSIRLAPLTLPPHAGPPLALGPPRPFFLLKAPGLGRADALARWLRRRGVPFERGPRRRGASRLAVALYDLDLAERPPDRWIHLPALRAAFPETWDLAALWPLGCAPERLPALKRAARRRLGFAHVRPDGGAPLTLMPLHAPDPDRVEAEWAAAARWLRPI